MAETKKVAVTINWDNEAFPATATIDKNGEWVAESDAEGDSRFLKFPKSSEDDLRKMVAEHNELNPIK